MICLVWPFSIYYHKGRNSHVSTCQEAEELLLINIPQLIYWLIETVQLHSLSSSSCVACNLCLSLFFVIFHLRSSVCFSHRRPVVKAAQAPSLIASAPPARHLSLLVNIMVCSIFSTVPFIIDLANCASTCGLERQRRAVRCRSDSY